MEGFAFRNIRNVELVRERGALGARIAATFLDFFVFLAYGIILFLWEPTQELIRGSTTFGVLFYLPVFFYHFICEAFFEGRSIGKYTMGIRVMNLDGSSPTLGNYFLRWIFRSLDMMFGWTVGILSIVLTENGQRIGDLAAGTVLVRDRRPPSIGSIWAPPEEDRELCFEEAAQLTDQEVAVLKEALDRWKYSERPIQALTERIKERTGLETELSPKELARTLIADHDLLFRKGWTKDAPAV